MVAVASPDYIARHGKPLHPRDLMAHRCITTWWPTDLSPYYWEFEKDGETLEVAVEGPLGVNEAELAARAAMASVGIAYLFEHQVEQGLAQGALVTLLDEWTPAFPGFYLYYPRHRQMLPALRAFVDFLGSSAR